MRKYSANRPPLFWGLGLPFFGAIADRFGTWRVLAMGGIIYAAGLFLMATADSVTMLHVGGGVLVGLGVAAGSFSIVLAAFARHTPPEKRSIVFGIGTAAGSAGASAAAGSAGAASCANAGAPIINASEPMRAMRGVFRFLSSICEQFLMV